MTACTHPHIQLHVPAALTADTHTDHRLCCYSQEPRWIGSGPGAGPRACCTDAASLVFMSICGSPYINGGAAMTTKSPQGHELGTTSSLIYLTLPHSVSSSGILPAGKSHFAPCTQGVTEYAVCVFMSDVQLGVWTGGCHSGHWMVPGEDHCGCLHTCDVPV